MGEMAYFATSSAANEATPAKAAKRASSANAGNVDSKPTQYGFNSGFNSFSIKSQSAAGVNTLYANLEKNSLMDISPSIEARNGWLISYQYLELGERSISLHRSLLIGSS
jgi:hypothetical protein